MDPFLIGCFIIGGIWGLCSRDNGNEKAHPSDRYPKNRCQDCGCPISKDNIGSLCSRCDIN